jgi:ectoine hydroxylase-related dioxygenase (phytanoyl-CoA dioxygenase family)
MDLERWEPALRALFHGRAFFDAASAVLRDRSGVSLELRRPITLADAADDVRHVLHEAGFVHVRGVFGADEIARIGALVAEQARRAVPDDGTSWWAVRRDGARVLCRLVYLGLRVPEIAALSDDPRLLALAALAPEPVRPALDRSDGHSVVIKNAEVRAGLSDLPWHRDCGLGGHPVTCPTLNVGIQLDAATAASGRLHFLAGSHRGSVHRSMLTRPDLPIVPVDTEPGDVTVHLGDVLHAAPPPEGSGPGRRALYLTFMPPRAFDVIGPGASYNDVIRLGAGQSR